MFTVAPSDTAMSIKHYSLNGGTDERNLERAAE